jgi:enamine deaminase RidA (YjgF/YER057c/UK114 family)
MAIERADVNPHLLVKDKYNASHTLSLRINMPNDQPADAGSIESRIMALRLTLPAPSAPAFQYVPVVIHRDVAYVSGQLPRMGGGVVRAGKVGGEVSVEHAQNAARICILQGLACLKQALGSLDQVKRILKVTGFVASAQGFVEQPAVIDAASQLLVDLFGNAGRHARSAVGVAELPRNSPVEIEMIAAIRTSRR